VKRAVAALAGVLLGVGAFTWWTLEASEVAVLVTQRPDGMPRETHVWWAEHGGAIWLEAATPERGWLDDARRAPDVELERVGQRVAYRAEPVPEASGHDRIRALLREKYGFRDRWVGLFQDTSRSVAVRLMARERGDGGKP